MSSDKGKQNYTSILKSKTCHVFTTHLGNTPLTIDGVTIEHPLYRIHHAVFADGERFPLLVDADNGAPLFDATVFATTIYRNAAKATNTIEQVLRGIMIWHLFARHAGIDIISRLRNGILLSTSEIEEFIRYSSLALRTVNRKVPSSPPKERLVPRKINPIRIFRRLEQPVRTVHVQANTKSLRLDYAVAYLEWLWRRETSHLHPSVDSAEYFGHGVAMFKAMRARIPAQISHSRLAITNEQRRELLRLIDIHCPDNPWKDEFVRHRNQLIVLWALGTGLRRGELLGMTVDRVETPLQRALIVRNSDDKRDPRRRQPTAKTRGRYIFLGAHLTSKTIAYLSMRSKIPAARKHPFLLVSITGSPMSFSSLTQAFKDLRDASSALKNALSMHILRHVWNEDFSDLAEEMSMSPEEEMRIRTEVMGWSSRSAMPEKYQKRRTRKKSQEFSVRIQNNFMDGLDE